MNLVTAASAKFPLLFQIIGLLVPYLLYRALVIMIVLCTLLVMVGIRFVGRRRQSQILAPRIQHPKRSQSNISYRV